MLLKSIFIFIIIIILIIVALIIGIFYIWPYIKAILILIFNFIRRMWQRLLGMKHSHGPFHHGHGKSVENDESKDEKPTEESKDESEQQLKGEVNHQNRLFRKIMEKV
ncbi:hypothetical protein M153_20900013173 [Pseudoloma neurophilia]|uniref:Uncharacterized protein n=1 Tax=Pseudoloma neurophilia TaxID=146866 RepID=A0A0R0M664_9MICR|nr:hypothetical protein M153_20900013173 [Pseudoloma neurophilia]